MSQTNKNINTWFMDVFSIEKTSPTPTYQQLVNVVSSAVKENILKQGDRLPSINQLSAHYQVSRATIEKALENLKKRGIVQSAPYKGFFVAENLRLEKHKILLLFNNQGSVNDLIYKSFLRRVGSNVQVDCLVYNNNAGLFNHMAKMKSCDTDFVVIPQIADDFENLFNNIMNLPGEKLSMLEKYVEKLSG
ncbi:GntR family transcriptional regulator [Dyadobacter subterraneus]|uniref:Winged helix-turn-helix transcriptional regulator n=1 Tax=Dyadobacter subterraneus TaxID=2773304 RepID=A0ABR9WDJ7_9BACT|nr:winged helix-turn-helix domain-containing protein [Dyadobacter subterraneus]MBE9463495.1 winged helix-turn-helix transcriptional regulator [Dyadobacter subterraneus]